VIVALLFLTGCPQNQEKSLTQIRSQLTVLSTEMRDSFDQSEKDRVSLYKGINDDIKLLKKNQADVSATSEELRASLTAIDAKLDEYNTRMARLNERLNTVEQAFTERITFLSDQVSELGQETTISSGTPSVPRQPTPTPSGPQDDTREEEVQPPPQRPVERDSDPENAEMYQKAYMAYVNGNFDSAIAGFERYLELYPGSERTDLAQYWIAESFFSLGEFETALGEYDKLIAQYPRSDRIPAAYFSKADAYLKLDRQIEAISHLRYIVNQFEGTNAARRAEERLRALEQE
jgi:tol-pal system protein YbgF